MDSVFVGWVHRDRISAESAAARSTPPGMVSPYAGARLQKSRERSDLCGQLYVEEDYAGVDEGAVSGLVAPVMDICGNVL